MNEKSHCRDNCRYHYTLIRELVSNQKTKRNIILQVLYYLCAAIITFLAFNTIIASVFIRDVNLLDFYVKQIHATHNLIYNKQTSACLKFV